VIVFATDFPNAGRLGTMAAGVGVWQKEHIGQQQ
jgi:hypothetical protein